MDYSKEEVIGVKKIGEEKTDESGIERPWSADLTDSKPKTFWTTCRACKYNFEYYYEYLGRTIFCQNCRTAFLAMETTRRHSSGPSTFPWSDFEKYHIFLDDSMRETRNLGSSSKAEYEAALMSSEFYDFENGRTELSFNNNQIWAMYDNVDGMPRIYVLVQNVMSIKPFILQVNRLSSQKNDELSQMSWRRSEFLRTCGNFQIDKDEIYDSLNSFSHIVKWTRNSNGEIQIYPMKGETWALYENWTLHQDEDIQKQGKQNYEIVQVIENYDKKNGVVVSPLVKVSGFKNVFRIQGRMRTIPGEEIFRFSHQVPTCLLTIDEGQNAPVGCLELDPASTPMELCNILTED